MTVFDGNGSPFLPFTKELRQIAELLEARGVSAELLNRTLAARTGLPIVPVDPKSTIFEWSVEQSPNLADINWAMNYLEGAEARCSIEKKLLSRKACASIKRKYSSLLSFCKAMSMNSWI